MLVFTLMQDSALRVFRSFPNYQKKQHLSSNIIFIIIPHHYQYTTQFQSHKPNKQTKTDFFKNIFKTKDIACYIRSIYFLAYLSIHKVEQIVTYLLISNTFFIHIVSCGHQLILVFQTIDTVSFEKDLGSLLGSPTN